MTGPSRQAARVSASRTVRTKRTLADRGLAAEIRGATMVEYVIVVGVVALASLAGFRMFGQTVRAQTAREAACVANLDCPATGSSGGAATPLLDTDGKSASDGPWYRYTWESTKSAVASALGNNFNAEPVPRVVEGEPIVAPGRANLNYDFASDPGERRNRVWTDGTTGVRARDATETQARIIQAAVAHARPLLDGALARLENPNDPPVREALLNVFHASDPKLVASIRARLVTIRKAFDDSLPIDVEHTGDPHVRGYVHRFPRAWSDIHLNPSWFDSYDTMDSDLRAAMLIHECSHKYAGTEDYAYGDEVSYEALSPQRAVDNADSYKLLCLALRRKGER